MSKRVNKERVCCLVVFYEEIIVVFLNENCLKLTPTMRKKPKIFKYSMFLCSFCQIIDRPRGLEWQNPYTMERLLVSVSFC